MWILANVFVKLHIIVDTPNPFPSFCTAMSAVVSVRERLTGQLCDYPIHLAHPDRSLITFSHCSLMRYVSQKSV